MSSAGHDLRVGSDGHRRSAPKHALASALRVVFHLQIGKKTVATL